MDKNISFILIALIIILLLIYMTNTQLYSKTEQGLIYLCIAILVCIIVYTYNKKNYISESFTNSEESQNNVTDTDIYSEMNKRENVIKSTISVLNGKLDATIHSIKSIPHNIYNISTDLLNIYKFITVISKFFLKFGDKINEIDKTKAEITNVWNDTKKHREYIQHRVQKNYDLWDKCLGPDGFNKNFNECKTAYLDTKKFENYLRNNYPKFSEYLSRPGGLMDKIGIFDMKDIMSVLGDNNADIENNYKNYVEKLENLHNKKV